MAFFVPVVTFGWVNIWLLNPFDALPWEGPAQRYATLARCLAAEGHSVVHWSSGFSHTFKAQRRLPDDLDTAALPYAIELIDCPGYRSNVSLARVLNHQLYGRRFVSAGRRAVASGRHAAPDLILASMPPVEGPGAALKLKQHFGCKMVVDVMDAWPDTLLQAVPQSLRGPGRLFLSPYYRQLRRGLRGADGVCAQSQAFADFARKHGAAGAVAVFYLGGAAAAARSEEWGVRPLRGVESEEWGVESSDELPACRAAHEVDLGCGARQESRDPGGGALRLLYLGAMGRSYDLETLFDAVAWLNRDAVVVTLDMVGEGAKRDALEARGVPGVRFHGYLNGAQLAKRMQAADLGIVPFLPGSGVALPYKAADYLAYGLPVISSIDGELGQHLRQYRCGATYPALDADALAAVLHSYASDRPRLAREQTAALQCFDAHFDRARIYPDYVKWLEALLA